MLQAQSLRLRARKKSGDLTTAIVPAGTSFPAVPREPFDLVIARYAATSFFDQLNSVPSTHIRCRMTASLRATATVAFRSPLRLASLSPQAFSADHFGTRVSSTPAASKRYLRSNGVTTLRDASRPVDLPGSVASGRQSDIGANTS